jgi:ubiquinol-cytochrome c reductase cytochrome b subunit
VAVFIAFAILFTLAIAARVPLERMADPTDTSYIPRPEWYFLFLFQSLKLFEGPLELVGTVILPTLAILALIATPFIDRSRLVRVRQRTLAMGIVVLAGLGWAGLTVAAIRSTPPQTAAAMIDFSGPTQWMQLTPAQLSGIGFYRQQKCDECHNVTGGTPKQGPHLMGAARRHDDAWLIAHFKQPSATSGGTAMAPVHLTDAQMKDLVALMKAMTPDNADVIDTAPDFAVDGAMLYQKNFCGGCHAVNGEGGKMGPALNGLATRRTEAWVVEHFENPRKMSPGTPMPAYPFPRPDMQNMVSYLFTLPDKAP